MMEIRLKKLRTSAILPTYGSRGAAGADLYACIDNAVVIAPHETKLIPSGIAAAIPEGYVGLVFARSGMGIKRHLAPANKVGVIDSDYRGEIMVALHNHGTEAAVVESGERVAQLAIVPVVQANFIESDELDDTPRGGGMLGSTGRF